MKINKLFVYLTITLISPFVILKFLSLMVMSFGLTLYPEVADIIGTSVLCWAVGGIISCMVYSFPTNDAKYFTLPFTISTHKEE